MSNIVKYLKDYKKPDYLIANTNLHFEVLENKIIVTSILNIIKNNVNAVNIELNGNALHTISVFLNNKILQQDTDYSISNDLLVIYNVNHNDIIKTIVEIDPFNNTSLMGIYKSNNCIVSQCEPEGFRKITWYIDRPDVMSLWTVSIVANKNNYPYLISNGNIAEQKELPNNKQQITFIDLLPKPCYLFAFVAGDFDVLKDQFITKSNKTVDLFIYVEKGKLDQSYFAMESLKKAMKWDEDTFNLEYELSIFSIVAVSDFNFGAMENKSLNIFNDALILANPKIATDGDYFNIEAVVAHEYFHNFTGNRITCRDWFQLTLKEGLTVYRDQRFSADMHNADITRIDDVITLKAIQFAEDKGPLSHPIRPTSYIEMNNFYTSTVYDKGAEIIRMIEVIIGKDNFKKGIQVYFDKFDGQAVTCEDFVYAMEQASNIDLTQFKNWYLQSGTPYVKVTTNYNKLEQKYIVTITQTNKVMPEHNKAFNLVIPLKLALFNKQGKQVNKEYTAIVNNTNNTFEFNNIVDEPILSINRGFTAPVNLEYEQSNEEIKHLINYDTDGFVKYNSLQLYLIKCIKQQINNVLNNNILNTQTIQQDLAVYADLLKNYSNNIHLTAILLNIPGFIPLENIFTSNYPIEAIEKVITAFELEISNLYYNQFIEIFNNLKDNPEKFSAKEMAIRSLKNKCLYYIAKQNSTFTNNLVLNYYNNSNNITNKIAALVAIKNNYTTEVHKHIYNDFYNTYINYPTALNKWFNLSAAIPQQNIIEHLNSLTSLSSFSFSNPNKVRYLISGFIMGNVALFNNVNGSGYKYLQQLIIKLDSINPSMSAGLAKHFAKRYLHNSARQNLITEQLNIIINNKEISKGLFEIVNNILNS